MTHPVTWSGGGVQTAGQLQRKHRRLDRRNSGVAAVITEMRRGASLILHYQHGRELWHLSTGRFVGPEIAKRVTACAEVVACGDSLFLDMPSQTWRFADV